MKKSTSFPAFLCLHLSLLFTPIASAQLEAINPSTIPDPDAFLNRLSENPDYQSAMARSQATIAFEQVINDLKVYLIEQGVYKPQLKPSLDPLIQQFNAKLTLYDRTTRELLEPFEGEIFREAASPTSSAKLYVIDTFAPEYAIIRPTLYAKIQSEAKIENKEKAKRLARTEKTAAIERRFAENNGSAYFAVFATVFIILALGTRRSIKDKGASFQVDSVIGEVMREQKRSSTTFTETITPANSPNQMAGRSISSTTTNYQEIFLKLASGKEARLDFTNFKIPCREGHKLSAISVKRNGGAYRTFAYHNHATEETTHLKGVAMNTIRSRISKALSYGWLILFIYGAILYMMFNGYLGKGVGFPEYLMIGISAFVQWGIVRAIYNSLSGGRARKRLNEIYLKMRQVVSRNEALLRA